MNIYNCFYHYSANMYQKFENNKKILLHSCNILHLNNCFGLKYRAAGIVMHAVIEQFYTNFHI